MRFYLPRKREEVAKGSGDGKSDSLLGSFLLVNPGSLK